MAKRNNFRKLEVWHSAIDLAEKIYQVTNEIPDAEKFNLIMQLRRAAISVPSNIAEGYGRGTSKEISRYIWIAKGSLNEIETQLVLAIRFNYLPESSLNNILRNIDLLHRRLYSLAKYNGGT